MYLNSTVVDSYFRQFSGHTQANPTDLRRLRYPSRGQLHKLAASAAAATRDQDVLSQKRPENSRRHEVTTRFGSRACPCNPWSRATNSSFSAPGGALLQAIPVWKRGLAAPARVLHKSGHRRKLR